MADVVVEDAPVFEEAMPVVARGGADDNIQVLVRVRPPNSRELEQGYAKGVHASGQSVDIPGRTNATYSYDHVCDEQQSQAEIFESVGVPVTDAFLEGYHGCLIAYGQTGAGKTFTMQGPDDHTAVLDQVMEEADDAADAAAAAAAAAAAGIEAGADASGGVDIAAVDSEHQGLIPRVLKRIFQRIADEKAGVDPTAADAEEENDAGVANDAGGGAAAEDGVIPPVPVAATVAAPRGGGGAS